MPWILLLRVTLGWAYWAWRTIVWWVDVKSAIDASSELHSVYVLAALGPTWSWVTLEWVCPVLALQVHGQLWNLCVVMSCSELWLILAAVGGATWSYWLKWSLAGAGAGRKCCKRQQEESHSATPHTAGSAEWWRAEQAAWDCYYSQWWCTTQYPHCSVAQKDRQRWEGRNGGQHFPGILVNLAGFCK